MKKFFKRIFNNYKYELEIEPLKTSLDEKNCFEVCTGPSGLVYRITKDLQIVEIVAGAPERFIGRQYFRREFAEKISAVATIDEVLQTKPPQGIVASTGYFQGGKLKSVGGIFSWAKLGKLPNVLATEVVKMFGGTPVNFYAHQPSDGYGQKKYFPIFCLKKIK